MSLKQLIEKQSPGTVEARALATAVEKYHRCEVSWLYVIHALRRWQRAVGFKQTPMPKE